MNLLLEKLITQDEKKLLRPYEHILKCPGKEIRPKLFKALNHWFHLPPEEVDLVSSIICIMHNCSLLVDDIEDNSLLRRGSPAAHTIFGIPETLNTTNFVSCMAMEKIIAEFPDSLVADALTIFNDKMIELIEGQGLDIYWRDNFICPSAEEYIAMVQRKTGALFLMGLCFMELLAGGKKSSPALSTLLARIGVYFQIRDDYANLESEKYAEEKSFCEDFSEGKFSYPIVHAIQEKAVDGELLLGLLKLRTQDDTIKRRILSLLKEAGSIAYTKATMDHLLTEIVLDIEECGGNPHLEMLVNYLKKV